MGKLNTHFPCFKDLRQRSPRSGVEMFRKTVFGTSDPRLVKDLRAVVLGLLCQRLLFAELCASNAQVPYTNDLRRIFSLAWKPMRSFLHLPRKQSA